MKITYLIKKAVGAVTCFGIMLSTPVWSACQSASAEDAPYSIVLSAETKEVDKNNLPNDRMVDVKLSIENNPGFSEMYIIIQKSSALSFYYPSSPVIASGKYSGIKNELFEENKDVVCLTVPSYPKNKENGSFATVQVKLPDTVNPGDFFEINYLDSFQIPERELSREAGILKDRNLTGKNSFSQMTGGGIKIIETSVTEPPHNDPQPDPPPSNDNDSQPQDQQPSDQQNQNNEPQPEQTQAPQGETQETQVSNSEITSMQSTSPVSEKPIVSSGTTSKKTTQLVTSTETTVTDDQNNTMASSDSIKMKPDRTVEIILIVAIIVVSVLGVVTFIGVYKYYRKKDQK